MSVKVMGNVWELDLPPSHKLVLLAMADHADHDGRNVHPSVRLIAHKTGYSERQVQRIFRDLEADHILIADTPTTGGRGHTTHYRIVTTNGVILTPFRKGDIPEETVTSATEKGDIPAIKGDTSVTRTVIEPPRESLSDRARQRLADFRRAYPLHRRSGNARELAEQWAHLSDSEQAQAIAAVQAWAESDDWRDQNGKFVPGIVKFLDERRWESAPATIPTTGNKTVDLLKSMGI